MMENSTFNTTFNAYHNTLNSTFNSTFNNIPMNVTALPEANSSLTSPVSNISNTTLIPPLTVSSSPLRLTTTSFRFTSPIDPTLPPRGKCKDARCLECTRPDRCSRCIDFIEEGSGKCLDACKGSFVLMVDGGDLQGKVCSVSGDMMMTIYIAVIIGVGAGILFTSILALVFYWRLRRYKRKTKIEALKNRVLQNGAIQHINKSMISEKSIPPAPPRFHNSFDNQSYASQVDSYSMPPPPPHAMGRSAFFAQLAILRPYTDTFLNMIQEAKDRNHSLAANDDRALVYRNMIHQLCRVVELLTIPLSQVLVPADGEALLTWAHKVLHNYLKVQGDYSEASSSVSSAPVTSTFKPDHLLVPNGSTVNNSHGSSPSNTYKYERCDSGSSATPSTFKTPSGNSGNRSQGGITLSDDFTEPIEV